MLKIYRIKWEEANPLLQAALYLCVQYSWTCTPSCLEYDTCKCSHHNPSEYFSYKTRIIHLSLLKYLKKFHLH